MLFSRLDEVLETLDGPAEVILVDDGSTDDTHEIAIELATRFPQVTTIRHPFQLGYAESVQTGLDNSDGEVVIVGDERHGLDVRDLRRLWRERNDDR